MIHLHKYLADIDINQETKNFIHRYVNEAQALIKELSIKGMRVLHLPDMAFIIKIHKLCMDSDYVLSILNTIDETGTAAYQAFERLGLRIDKINMIALEHYKPQIDSDSSDDSFSDDDFSNDDIEDIDINAYPTEYKDSLENHKTQIRISIDNLKVSTSELITGSERQFTHDLAAIAERLLVILERIETVTSHSNTLASDATSSSANKITMDAIAQLSKQFKLYESSIGFMIRALFDDKMKFSTSAAQYAFYDALKTNYCLIKTMYMTVSLVHNIKPAMLATPVAISPAFETHPDRSQSTDVSRHAGGEPSTYPAYRSQSASSNVSSLTNPHPIMPSFFALSISRELPPPSPLRRVSPVPH